MNLPWSIMNWQRCCPDHVELFARGQVIPILGSVVPRGAKNILRAETVAQLFAVVKTSDVVIWKSKKIGNE